MSEPDYPSVDERLAFAEEHRGRPALELHVYPTWENGLDGTVYANKDDDRHPVRVDYEVLRKQLTKPELAAEYWHFDLADFDWPGDPDDLTDEQWAEWRKRHGEARAALDRFARLPHAADSGYE